VYVSYLAQFQDDLGGDILIDDIQFAITKPAAFDAVIRVRTSTGKYLVNEIEMWIVLLCVPLWIFVLIVVLYIQAVLIFFTYLNYMKWMDKLCH